MEGEREEKKGENLRQGVGEMEDREDRAERAKGKTYGF